MRDELSLVKCHKNQFGRKDYKVLSDKSALAHHVNKIVKSDIERAARALPKPYLVKQFSYSTLPQDYKNLKQVAVKDGYLQAVAEPEKPAPKTRPI